MTFKLSNSQKSEYQKIHLAFERGDYNKIEKDGSIRPGWMTARIEQENLLVTTLATQKDQFILSLLKRQQANEFDGIHPILIFYQYTLASEHLRNLLTYAAPEYRIVMVNGHAKISEEDMNEPHNLQSIYLVQYEAGGEGLDWQWSNISVFYEAPVRYEKYVQANGRNLRNKSIMPKVYHFGLEYSDTYDGLRWQVNRNKKDFTKNISERTFLQEK